MTTDEPPLGLPEGHRIRRVFLWTPTTIAGRRRWLESVRVVQRLGPHRFNRTYKEWHEIGYWDELFPAPATKPAVGAWESEPG